MFVIGLEWRCQFSKNNDHIWGKTEQLQKGLNIQIFANKSNTTGPNSKTERDEI